MEAADRLSDEVRIVAHREVVSVRDDDLPCVWKKRLPARLESERIVALAEDGEERQRRQRPGERARDLVVERDLATRVAQVVVERRTPARDAGAVRLPIGAAEVATDAEPGGREARECVRRDVEGANGPLPMSASMPRKSGPDGRQPKVLTATSACTRSGARAAAAMAGGPAVS